LRCKDTSFADNWEYFNLYSSCVERVANCKENEEGDLEINYYSSGALCAECKTHSSGSKKYVLKSDKTECKECNAIDYCDEYSVKSDGTGCECTKCLTYAYLSTDKTTCTSTRPAGCLSWTTDGTAAWTCDICKYGRKWDDTTKDCVACSADSKCVQTGCSALDYPTKKSGGGSDSDDSNSSILVFLMSALFTLLTFMI
jgi:hypothetical protein